MVLLTMADSIGQKGISKRYPVESSSGLGADDHHEGRQINLVPEEGSKVSSKVKELL